MPRAQDGSTVPLVTEGTFKNGVLATAKSRTSCLYRDATIDGKQVTTGDMGRLWQRDLKTGVFTAPPPSTRGHSGGLCVPWPPGELLLSTYRRADDAITTPAVKAVAQLQRRRLSTSLDCAYIRPVASRGRPAYAAFNDRSLRDQCLEMRKRLLTHPARMEVEYETAVEVDPEYADALRAAGVPTTAIQRAAAKAKLAGGTARPLDPGAALPLKPLPLQGGLPFDPNPEGKAGPSWLKPAIYGGAALVSTLAIAVGVARARSTRGEII